MTIAELVIQIAVKLENVNQGFEQAAAQLDKFVAGTEKTQATFTQFGIAAEAVGIGIAAVLGIMAHEAGQAEVVLARLGEAAAASSQQINVEKLREYATALQRVRAVSEEQVLSFQRFLVSAQLTQSQIEQLTPRVLNLARTLEIGPDQAAQAVARAMTLGAGALRRLGLAIDETVDPVRNFTGFLNALDQATGQSAEAFAKTLPGAIIIATNNFKALLAVVGVQLLPSIKAASQFISDLTIRLRAFADANPLLVKTLVAIAAALAGILLVAGPILIALGSISAIIAGIAAAGGLTAVLALSAGVLGSIATVVAGLVITANLAEKVHDFYIKWGVRLGFISPLVRGISTETSHTKEVLAASARIYQEQKLTLEQITAQHKRITDEIEAQANAQKLAASEQATASFETPGLTEGDLRAIEERKTRLLAEGERTRLRLVAASLEAQRRAILQARPETGQDQADFDAKRGQKLAEIDREVAKTRLQIQESFEADAQKIAERTVDAERDAAQARLDVFRAELEDRATLLRQRVENERDLARQRSDLDEIQRQGAIERLRRTEEIRLSLLRKSIDTENSLRQNAIRIQEGLNRAQESREQQALSRRARARQQLVQQGFFSPEEAQQIDTAEQEQAQRAKIQREIELEQQRTAAQLAAVDRSIQLAKIESASRIAVLDAEHDARVAQFRLNQDLRVADLNAAIQIAHAETVARLKEIQAVTDAEVAKRQALLQARQAAGEISPGEAAAQQAAINAIQQGSVAQQKAITEGFNARVQASKDAVAISTQSRDAQIKLATEERDARKKALTEDLKLDLQRFESERLTIVQTSVAKIKELEAQIPKEFEVGFASMAKIAAEGMKTLEDQFRGFVQRGRAILKPLVDDFKFFQQPGGMTLPDVPTARLNTNVPVSASAFQAPVAQRTQVTVPLILNGQILAQAVMEFMDGALESTDLRNPVGA